MPLRRVVIGLTLVAATVGATAVRRPAAAPVTLVLGVDRPGALNREDDVRGVLRGHQLRRRRRPVSRAGQEPLLRVPRAAHGLEARDASDAGTFTVRTDAPVSPRTRTTCG